MHSKRDFLTGLARVGGLGAAFMGMQALGLTPAGATDADFALPPSSAHGTRVVILGGGISGLAAAWELRKAGYACTVLEARARTGGRNWSIRAGDRIAMTDGTVQDCAFDPGLYWNAGPARLPGIHKRIHRYCRELGVKLELEVNTVRAERLYNPASGQPAVEMRQVANDTRGAVSELLAKAIDRGALDQEIGVADRERIFAFLKQYGDLTPEKLYKGSSRAGWKTDPGVTADGVARAPLPLDALLDLDLWNGLVYEDIIDQQATMFQPVGGMDHIPRAFEARLGPIVRKNAEVTRIRRRGEGVRIEYRDTATGRAGAVDADYCISTLPLVVLSRIPADFSPAYRAAIGAVKYHESVKIAWQSRRFWEQDYGIYGGISWVKAMTNMVWYPSGELFSDQGVLIGAYASNRMGDGMAALPLAEQFAVSRRMVEGLHPGHGRELARPLGIAWRKIPYAMGAAPLHGSATDPDVSLLATADGPFHFAGDYLSHVGNWQEAALASTHMALARLDTERRSRIA